MSTPNTSPTADADEKEPLILTESDDIGSESDLTEKESDAEHEEKSPKGSGPPAPASDPRFDQPTPSPFKRAALIILTIFLFWLALSMRKSLWEGKKAQKVIYASRYSKEHKFRPAASPIITETLKDGRVRIRGAGPTATPTPTPVVKKTKVKRKGRKTVKKGARKASTRK